METFARAEARKKPNPELLFTNVYKNMEWHIENQQKAMKQHVNNYAEHYPIDSFERWKD